jgi:hypothetical protein
MRRFSGLVTPWNAPMMAVALVRRIVVQQDQHLVGVVEIPLELLDAGAGHRAADLGDQRSAHEVREGQEAELGVFRAQLLALLADAGAGLAGGHGHQVHERGARVAQRLQDARGVLPAAVLDDDAGAGREVGFQIGLGLADVAGGDGQARVVKTPRERPALDEKVDVETGRQDLCQRPDDQLTVADGQASHARDPCAAGGSSVITRTSYYTAERHGRETTGAGAGQASATV